MTEKEINEKEMIKTGRVTLYLIIVNNGSSNYAKVTNWSGTLHFDFLEYKKGNHNITGKRYDTWFIFNGYFWHGVTYGDNTQICHCKQTKEKAN